MQRIRILLVEDNPAIHVAVAEALTDAGLAVTAAVNAKAARELIEDQMFDVLVTDIHLEAEHGGLDVARHWRLHCPGCPVVFATAYPRAAVDIGPLGPRDAFLVKPYSPSELLTLVQFVLRPVSPPV